ncbi:YppF family protein [Oceanobacillus massiliensis]|uniref:YppF family protein n=1 Tax=Oceanobacillus massiliensis TaxID=1465765 RepID=UPI000287DB3F|nr:YppF family protein [Oceanobacillus massiliensis]
MIHELLDDFENEHKFAPLTIDNLLDYYQKKYINGEIDIKKYHNIYSCLHEKGAVSAHEYSLNK